MAFAIVCSTPNQNCDGIMLKPLMVWRKFISTVKTFSQNFKDLGYYIVQDETNSPAVCHQLHHTFSIGRYQDSSATYGASGVFREPAINAVNMVLM